MDGIDEGVELEVPAQPPRRMEVLADPLPQVARFADVDHRAKPILHQVDARAVRQLAQLVSNVLRRGHDSSMPENRRAFKGTGRCPRCFCALKVKRALTSLPSR